MNTTVGLLIICVVAFLVFLYTVYTPKKDREAKKKAKEAKLKEEYERDNYERLLNRIADYRSKIEICDNLIRKRSEEIIKNILSDLERKSPEKVEKIFFYMEDVQTGTRKDWSCYYDTGMFTEVPVYGMEPRYKLVVKEEFQDELNKKLCNICARDERVTELKKKIEGYKRTIDFLEMRKPVYEKRLKKFQQAKEC